MIDEAPGPINFTLFISIFGEKFMGGDREDTIKQAFRAFDDSTGKVNVNVLKKALTTFGEKLTDEEIEAALADAPVDKKGNVDILSYVKTLTGSADEDMD